MGDEPLHGKVPEKFPEQGRQVDYGEAAKATGGWELGVTTAGDRDGGVGVWRYGIICPEEAEYFCILHHDAAGSRPLLGDGAYVWGVGC